MVIEAKYENGVFKPLVEVKLEEGTTVENQINHEQTARKAPSIRELWFCWNVGRSRGHQRWRELRERSKGSDTVLSNIQGVNPKETSQHLRAGGRKTQCPK